MTPGASPDTDPPLIRDQTRATGEGVPELTLHVSFTALLVNETIRLILETTR